MEPSAGQDTQVTPKADGLLWAGEHGGAHTDLSVSVLESILYGSRVQLPPRPVTPCTAHLPTGSLLEIPGMGGGTQSRSGTPRFALFLPQLRCCCQFSAVSQWQLTASSFYSVPGGCLLSLQLFCRLWLHGRVPELTHQVGLSQAPSSIGRVS